jgi:predicted DCC family thiol-disulfide oxidoreductase YuxK
MVSTAERDTVLYDASCQLCRRSRRAIERFDWLHRFRFVDASDHDVTLHLVPDATHDELLERMHVVRPDGRVISGFAAFRAMAPSLPIAWPLVPLLWLPGVRWLGERLYDRVARGRHLIGACTDEACRTRRSGTAA